MRRLAVIGGAALVLAGLGDAATGPSLRLASIEPLVVKGSHFRAPERVRVTVLTRGEKVTKRVRTTTGQFTVSFGTLDVDRCSSFAVRAVGSSGDSAVLKRLPPPMCAPLSNP